MEQTQNPKGPTQIRRQIDPAMLASVLKQVELVRRTEAMQFVQAALQGLVASNPDVYPKEKESQMLAARAVSIGLTTARQFDAAWTQERTALLAEKKEQENATQPN